MSNRNDRDWNPRRGGDERYEDEWREEREAGRGRSRPDHLSQGREFGSSRGGYGGEHDGGGFGQSDVGHRNYGEGGGRISSHGQNTSRDQYGEQFGDDYGMEGGFGQRGRQAYRGPQYARGGDLQRGYGSDIPEGRSSSRGRQGAGGDFGMGGLHGSSEDDFGGLERSRQASGLGTQRSYGAGDFDPGIPGGRYSSAVSHRGKGPKGYRRSDERIREDVCERLTEHGYLDASEIDVEIKEGVVTLSGSVEDRQSKRLAEEVAESVSGVKDVHNLIRSGGGMSALGTPQNTSGNLGSGGNEQLSQSSDVTGTKSKQPK